MRVIEDLATEVKIFNGAFSTVHSIPSTTFPDDAMYRIWERDRITSGFCNRCGL